MKKRGLYPYNGIFPQVDQSARIAPGARIVGDVRLGAHVSIWWNAVLRADLAPIIIGDESNIQDNAVLHVGRGQACILAEKVLVGHGAICHGCTIEAGALIGMGAIILSGATIGQHALIAAGALIPERTSVPPETLWAGNPAREVKKLGRAVLNRMREGVLLYQDLAALGLGAEDDSD